MNEKTFCLALNETGRIGYRLYQKLIQTGSIEDFVNYPERILKSTLPLKAKIKVCESLKNLRKIIWLEQQIYHHKWHIYTHKELLPYFLDNPDIPLILTGSFEIDSLPEYYRRIAIVGTSNPSSRALQITREIVQYLTRFNVLIISGLAKGIDRMAHNTALKSGGATLAFLPYGMQNIVPRLLHVPRLYFLTEAPYQDKWQKKWAILRNRLIALFSDSVVVVQSKPFGGSFYTAQYGVKYGRNVFTIEFKNDNTEGNRILSGENQIQTIRCKADLKKLLN